MKEHANDSPLVITEIDLPEACKVAPRVSASDVLENISSEHYFTGAEGVYGAGQLEEPPIYPPCPQSLLQLTICILVLRNGFTVTGESACASPENFDAEWGRKIAREKAIEKIWPLMGYALRERLAAPVQTD